jgi:hypothetical protein
MVAENFDREALCGLVTAGAPDGLPIVGGQLSAVSDRQVTSAQRNGRSVETAGSNGELDGKSLRRELADVDGIPLARDLSTDG